MPELFDVARHFDDSTIYDGYTGSYLFKGQFSTFMESAPEGSTSRRRTLSLAPSLVIPTRRVISILAEDWVVGTGILDGFDGKAIRKAFWLKYVTDTASLVTPKQACLGLAGRSIKLFREEFKYTVNAAASSQYSPFWSLSIAPVEQVVEGMLLRIPQGLLRVRMAALAKEGLDQVLCDEVGIPTTATVYTGTINPVTEALSVGNTVTSAIVFDRYKSFSLYTQADPVEHRGDKTILVPDSVNLRVGDKLSVLDRDWLVLARDIDFDCWSAHIRPL